MKGASLFCSLAALGALAGCGGQGLKAFDPTWVDDKGAAMADFQRSFKPSAVAGANVALGVAGPSTLLGLDLEAGGEPWTFEHELGGRPVIAGAVVVGAGAGEVFALEAKTGKLLWKQAAPGKLRGAADDGTTTLVSLATESGTGSILLAVERDGTVRRHLEEDAAIGAPAVSGDYALLPWKGKFLSVYDLSSGREKARLALPQPVSRVFFSGGMLFTGESAVARVDGDLPKATWVRPPPALGGLPGSPLWMRDGTTTPPRESDAIDKVHLYARPTASGAPGLDGNRFASTYFRVAMGFDGKTGDLVWAHAHGADFLGGAAYAEGFALCDAKGEVTFLDARNGGAAGHVSFGKPVEACVVQADGLKKPEAKGGSLAEQLTQVVEAPEAELATLQQLLLRQLAKLPEAPVTRSLLDLSTSGKASPVIRTEARALLANRKSGADFLLEALSRRYDYLAGVTRPPPVAPLADALLGMRDKRAAALLALHLDDPADTAEDVKHAAAALSQLAEPAELPALTAFFAHYRSMEAEEPIRDAVLSVAEALVRLGARDPVALAIADPLTAPDLKKKLVDLFAKPVLRR